MAAAAARASPSPLCRCCCSHEGDGAAKIPLDLYIPLKEYTPVDPFTALAEPTRRRIVGELRQSARTVNELAQTLAIGQPSVSKHLKVLREAQFVSCRGDAQRRIYSLEPGPFMAMQEWLEPYRHLWTERLDALEPDRRVGGLGRALEHAAERARER